MERDGREREGRWRMRVGMDRIDRSCIVWRNSTLLQTNSLLRQRGMNKVREGGERGEGDVVGSRWS